MNFSKNLVSVAMARRVTLVVVVFFCCTKGRGDTVISGGPVTGRWDIAGSPYIVQSNICVPSGAQLIVDPGVIVRFQTNTSLQITGSMVAQGTSTNRISFTSAAVAPVPGSWRGISVVAGGARTVLNYVEVAFATTAVTIRGDNAQVTVTNCEVHHSGGGGLSVDLDAGQYVSRSDVTICSNNIHHCSLGIDVSTSSSESAASIADPLIEGNELHNNTFGISLYSSSCNFCFARTAATDGLITGNRIRENATGVWASRSLAGQIESKCIGNLISNNFEVGVRVFNGADPDFINNLIINNTGNGMELGGANSSTIVNNTIAGNAATGFLHDSAFAGIFRNNIVVSNNMGIRCSSTYTPSTNRVVFNDAAFNVSGNWSNYSPTFGALTTTNANGTPADSESNISVDPLFLGAGDFHLKRSSPCVNAGSPTNLVSTDFDSKPRFAPGDIGCYEVQPEIRFGAPKRMPNGQLTLSIAPDVARTFTLESSTNFVNWTNVATVTNASGTIEISVNPSQSPRQFYRARP